jgi:para-nitrobenzyl esterase
VAGGSSALPLPDAGQAFRNGQYEKTQMLLGGTHDEGRLFVTAITDAQYPTLLNVIYGANGSAVMAEYALGQFETASLALATATTDYSPQRPISMCSNLYTAQFAAVRTNYVYTYEFTDEDAPPIIAYPAPATKNLPAYGAAHTFELGFLFDFDPPVTLSSSQAVLADQMIDYWSNFARTGNPNGPTVPQWRKFNESSDTQRLDTGPSGVGHIDIATEHNCAFWTSVGAS